MKNSDQKPLNPKTFEQKKLEIKGSDRIEPIILQPAYRFGKMTPWGGNALFEKYGRSTPDSCTGESLEMSVIEGLNSRDELGRSLSELIELYGERLIGDYTLKSFPLLLKIISAREKLSVQVHPDDAYSSLNEGKLGKTEAWIILDCREDAELIFGICENVSKAELKKASENGRNIEKLLRRVKIKPGDAFFIEAGTVHAIGEDTVLYEIQQSSDVTYRFYDWDRRDALGNKRELHIDKAIAVTRLDIRGEARKPRLIDERQSGRLFEVFSCPFFKTFKLENASGFALGGERSSFGVITAIGEAKISFNGKTTALKPLTSVLLPKHGYDAELFGDCFYISEP